jgi:integrase
MKRTGKHPDKALSSVRVNSLKEPGRYADGGGLYLFVDRTGAKRWVLRTMINGRRSDLGLGGLRDVPLAEARVKAAELRKIAKSGGNPVTERRARASIPTFAEAALTVHQQNQTAWKNSKHKNQWITTLQKYAFPTIGQLRVDQIETPHVLIVLSPIWQAKPETARRVKQRIETVLDWAKVAGHRSGENPVAGVIKGLPRQVGQRKHHAALNFTDTPAFIRKLHACDASLQAKLAFEFLILTAPRTSEVLGMKWNEIAGETWTVPAYRTKTNREFRIPLGPRCMEILRHAKIQFPNSSYVFPSPRNDQKPLTNMVFLMLLRRMGLKNEVTAHGFRSVIMDWAHETTSFPRLVVDMALNHSIRDKTEAAYRRGDLFEKRKDLMFEWDRFLREGSAA